jgi:hypothetical protein
MFFSGIPLAEQSKYVGENYLPAVASLKNRYAGIRSNLYQTLADQLGQYDLAQEKYGRDIYNTEVAQDLERERTAAAERAARASAGSGGASFGGLAGAGGQSAPAQQQYASLRDKWQAEANAGDNNAQVALNYAGNDGRFDGTVNSKWEYDVLKNLGIQGNYTYRVQSAPAVKSSVGGTQTISNNPLRR